MVTKQLNAEQIPLFRFLIIKHISFCLCEKSFSYDENRPVGWDVDVIASLNQINSYFFKCYNFTILLKIVILFVELTRIHQKL